MNASIQCLETTSVERHYINNLNWINRVCCAPTKQQTKLFTWVVWATNPAGVAAFFLFKTFQVGEEATIIEFLNLFPSIVAPTPDYKTKFSDLKCYKAFFLIELVVLFFFCMKRFGNCFLMDAFPDAARAQTYSPRIVRPRHWPLSDRSQEHYKTGRSSSGPFFKIQI